MNQDTKRAFFSKLLLFGEYTILQKGTACAIPYTKYSGSFLENKSSTSLVNFFNFLQKLDNAKVELIRMAIENKVYFKSTIPTGYGLGSSGALSAAAYDQFFEKRDVNLTELANILAEIESFFHGKSSGLDPLVSFLNTAILVDETKVSSIELSTKNSNLFLIDSHMSRSTKKLVQAFRRKYDSLPSFRKALQELDKQNRLAITALQNANIISLSEHFKHISQLQWIHFKEMIPEHIQPIWAKGLESEKYFLKLSGAGGGGYFLGISNVDDPTAYLATEVIYL